MARTARTDEERFWGMVNKDGPTAPPPAEGNCWLWTGARSSVRGGGELTYGMFRWGPGRRLGGAHRFSYELSHGRPIGLDNEIDHVCRNKQCVRPEHLEEVTHQSNSHRSSAWGPRSAGRGHIQQLGPDRYRVHINLGRDRNGKRHSMTKVIRGTRQEADVLLTRLQAEVDAGVHRAEPGSVADLAARWFESCHLAWAPNTRSVHKAALNTHIVPGLGPTTQVRKVRTADLDRLYGQLATAGKGPATIRRVHVVVRSMFAQAVRWDELGVNPALNASPPPVPEAQVEPPTPEEVRAILAEADARDPDLACFLRLCAATGCRRGEISALRWEDIDLERGQIMMFKALSAAGKWEVEGTKAMKSGNRRRIGVDPATLAILKAHRDRMLMRATKCDGAPLGPWVFSLDEAGRRPWHPSSVTHRFARVAKAAGVDTHLHGLRHFAATQALDAGVPVHAVAHRLGHARTSTTLDIYGGWVPDRDEEAARALGRAIDGS